MKLVSTRNSAKHVSAAEAIVCGLAADGGLFAPTSLPMFTAADLAGLEHKSYSDLVSFVAAPFLSGFSREELSAFSELAYKSFPDCAAPVISLDGSTHILELWHGPTSAFKDFALQLLPHLLGASLKKLGLNKTAVILAATSGDTGSAALEGFAGVPGTKICVFYPHGGVSAVQQLQMTVQAGENTKVIGIKGNFDDAQSGVKKIFAYTAQKGGLEEKGCLFSSANSINWGRIVPQIAYYFSAYSSLVSTGRLKAGGKMNVVVPTGNFGNILAACYAKKSGLPINRLICASNANNVLYDFINTGVYDKNRAFHTTVSPSMDILISSNLERFLFDLYDQDCGAVKSLMDSLAKTGRYEINSGARRTMGELLYGGYATDTATEAAIGEAWRTYGYLSDTHTAVGLKVYGDYVRESADNTPTVIVSTASPFKFADSTLKALGEPNIGADDFEKLRRLSGISGVEAPAALLALEGKKERHKTVCEPGEMREQVFGWLRE